MHHWNAGDVDGWVVKAGAAGPEVSTPMAWVLKVSDGKIARARDYVDQQEALQTFGPSD